MKWSIRGLHINDYCKNMTEELYLTSLKENLNPKKPLKETKVDLKRTNSPKKTNFVSNW